MKHWLMTWVTIVAMAAFGTPAAAESEWDGTWVYAFKGIRGADCGRFTKGSIQIRDGKFAGELFNLEYGDFTVTGGIRGDGALDNVQFIGTERRATLTGRFYKHVANGTYEGTSCSGKWEMFQTVFAAPDNDP